MRKYDTRDRVAADTVLIDLIDSRDHLSVQISLYQDGSVADPATLLMMNRKLNVLDARIQRHQTPTDV
jgi:hypothetical protein